MNPGRFDEHPMPETIKTLWGGIPSSRIASLIDFRTPKSPQPGHQSGCTSESRIFRVSSMVVAMHSLLTRPRARRQGMTRVHGARVHADDEDLLGGAGRASHELDLPDGLAVL